MLFLQLADSARDEGFAGLDTAAIGQDRGIDRRSLGRGIVEEALFMAAMAAVRRNPPMKRFCERIVGAGKTKMAALIAVARKLVVLLNAILRDKKPWCDRSKQGLARAKA